MKWKAAISKEEVNQSTRALQGTGLRGGNQSDLITQQWVRTD